MLDESNSDAVDNTRDILPALNRGKDFAFDILARNYPEPLLQPTPFTLVGNQAEYDIPEDIFEDRVLKLEIAITNANGRPVYEPVERISYRDISQYESSTTTNIPYYYCLYGRTIKFVPTPTGTYQARMWSLKPAERLVQPQGRITRVNEAGNYIIVDSVGDSITTEADQLGSYVNIIDGQTGEIRGTLQVQINADNKLTFRTTPTRSEVLNRDINTSLADIEVEEDDYICSIAGSCVPYFGTPTSNFLVQYAVAELTRKLGGNADMEERVLEKFEQQVRRTWVKRENSMRVAKKSGKWPQPLRRWNWEQ
jgi:hypothetical protein